MPRNTHIHTHIHIYLEYICFVSGRVLLDKMAAPDPQALLEPEVSLVLWDSLDLRVLLYVFHPFALSPNFDIKAYTIW